MFRPRRLGIRHLLFIVPLAAALLVLPATSASAHDPHANLDCTITHSTDSNPPITSEHRHRAATSHGLTGTADCTGTVDGHQVTGTGTFGTYAQGTLDCASGSGSGTFVLQIPTTGGTKTVAGRFDFRSSDIPGGASVLTGDLTGTFTVVAADGDCVNTPISHITSTITGSITT